MRTGRIGRIVAWTVVLLPLVIWLLAGPPEPAGRRGQGDVAFTNVGQAAGLLGMAMLSVAFVLSSRIRWLEDVFGGLDKMYRLHHQLGLSALVLLLVHPLALAARFVPDRWDRALTYLLPVHDSWTVDLGVYGFWGLLLLMALTLLSAVPYDKWRSSHRFLGLVLVLGTAHLATVTSTPGRTVAVAEIPALRAYMLVLAAMALACFVYRLAAVPLRARRAPYAVTAVDRANERVVRIELSPQRRPVAFAPGQFVFVTFFQQGLSREAHPFTICSVPAQERIVLTVKALGDFTGALYQRLEPGAEAQLEGPYGRFDYRAGSRRQIWIAAGVGVAPFLSWARDLAHRSDETREASLYYCVHGRGDAVYLDEFQRISARLPNLRAALVCSEDQGRLRAADIPEVRDRDVFMCGPKGFTRDLQKQLIRRGVPRHRIHFEDFEFR